MWEGFGFKGKTERRNTTRLQVGKRLWREEGTILSWGPWDKGRRLWV